MKLKNIIEKKIIIYYIGKLFLEFSCVDLWILNFLEPIMSNEKFRNLTMGQKLEKIKKHNKNIPPDFIKALNDFINDERNPFIHSYYFLGFGNNKKIEYTSFYEKKKIEKDISFSEIKKYYLETRQERQKLCLLKDKYIII